MSKKSEQLATGFNLPLPKPPPRTLVDPQSAERFASSPVPPPLEAGVPTPPSQPEPPSQPGPPASAPESGLVLASEPSLDDDGFEEAEPTARARAPLPRRAPTSKRRREEAGERLTVYLPPDLAMELRVLCARKRYSVSHAMTEAIQRWMRSENKPR